MCPDGNKQRNDATTSSSPGVTMMVTDPLSISISKPFLRSHSSGIISPEIHQGKVDDENDDTLLNATSRSKALSQTSIDTNYSTNHSKSTANTSFLKAARWPARLLW